MAVLHIILRDLSLIDYGFLGEEIHRKRLLKQSRTLILFVPQDALHGGSLPDGLFSGGGDALFRQHGDNVVAAVLGGGKQSGGVDFFAQRPVEQAQSQLDGDGQHHHRRQRGGEGHRHRG